MLSDGEKGRLEPNVEQRWSGFFFFFFSSVQTLKVLPCHHAALFVMQRFIFLWRLIFQIFIGFECKVKIVWMGVSYMIQVLQAHGTCIQRPVRCSLRVIDRIIFGPYQGA